MNKNHSSAKITFKTQNELKHAIKNSVICDEISLKTVEFQNIKPEFQCNKCQKFGHASNKCNLIAKCRICAKNHTINSHFCNICKSNDVCSHAEIKCANCNENHTSDNSTCEVYLSLKSIEKNLDPLHVW